MTVFTILFATFFLVISLSLMVLAIRQNLDQNRQIDRRLAENVSEDILGNGEVVEKRSILSSFGSHLTLPDSKEITRLRYLLSQAGFFHPDAIKVFIAVKVICLMVPLFIILTSWNIVQIKFGLSGTILIALLFVLFGLFGPTYYLNWKKSRRTDQCRKGFPDMMDLLVACLEAGLGIDAALSRVSQEIGGRYPVLKVNLEIMNLEIRTGRLRNDAMVNFANRIDLDEAKALAVMLKQAEDMGSSVGAALRVFSEDMKNKRMLLAEEKAMALSAKLTVPLILFIFPTIMVLLMVPAGIRILDGLV